MIDYKIYISIKFAGGMAPAVIGIDCRYKKDKGKTKFRMFLPGFGASSAYDRQLFGNYSAGAEHYLISSASFPEEKAVFPNNSRRVPEEKAVFPNNSRRTVQKFRIIGQCMAVSFRKVAGSFIEPARLLSATCPKPMGILKIEVLLRAAKNSKA